MDSPLQSEIFSSNAEKRVAIIFVERGDGSISRGHGVLINSSGSILTVSHLLYYQPKNSSKIVFHKNKGDEVVVVVNSRQYFAKIQYVNVDQETALLQIVRAKEGDCTKIVFDYATLASNITFGQKVFLVCSSDSNHFQYTEGTVGFFTKLDEEIGETNNNIELPTSPVVVVNNLNAISGFSGSPAFDYNGDIIGLLFRSDHVITDLVHPAYLRQFFNQTQVGTDGDIPGSLRGTDEKEKKKQKKRGEKKRRKEELKEGAKEEEGDDN